MMVGLLCRSAAIIQPGMFLSQPGSATLAVHRRVSFGSGTAGSAHRRGVEPSSASRWNLRSDRGWGASSACLKRPSVFLTQTKGHAPSVPMVMASDTPGTPKMNATMSSASTPSLTFLARSSRCMLQGLPSHQTVKRSALRTEDSERRRTRRDAHLRLAHVAFPQAGAIQHRLSASALLDLGQGRRDLVELRREAILRSGVRPCLLVTLKWSCGQGGSSARIRGGAHISTLMFGQDGERESRVESRQAEWTVRRRALSSLELRGRVERGPRGPFQTCQDRLRRFVGEGAHNAMCTAGRASRSTCLRLSSPIRPSRIGRRRSDRTVSGGNAIRLC